ncbi:hypothetical protein Sjap_007622 [Stephania japonica]|uniref:Uncharacterized protein n=1 Tax=Stephania japonica TaxID=461633 RepID=A0AAP0JPM3_9MAGN
MVASAPIGPRHHAILMDRKDDAVRVLWMLPRNMWTANISMRIQWSSQARLVRLINYINTGRK